MDRRVRETARWVIMAASLTWMGYAGWWQFSAIPERELLTHSSADVQDCYADSYANAPSDGSVVSGQMSCHRVVRGGSWGDSSGYAPSAVRGRVLPDGRGHNLGFRLARTLP